MKLRFRAFASLSVLIMASVSTAQVEMAVTVDDLPVHSKAPVGTDRLSVAKKMLKIFSKYRVPEVYGFINASKVEDDPSTVNILKLWLRNGYPLGNHTFSHKNINKVSVDEFKTEIEKNEPLLKELDTENQWKYFRFPFLIEGADLDRRNLIRAFLKEKSYTIAQVTVDFEDWSWNEPFARCSDKKMKRELGWLKKSYLDYAKFKLEQAIAITDHLYKRPVKHILLLHIGAFDAEMLDKLLGMYQKLGVKFIPLSESVKDEIYSFDPGQVTKHGTEFTFQVMKSRGLKLADFGLKEENVYPEEQLTGICK